MFLEPFIYPFLTVQFERHKGQSAYALRHICISVPSNPNSAFTALISALYVTQWVAIAEELGTGRHASACLARYQQHGQPTGKARRKWDAGEDERLTAAVKRHGRNWQVLAATSCFPNKC